ncbi:hypothetical protein [Chryseolinea soli]|nr:hypothetical protein [Chryseolinea soli]
MKKFLLLFVFPFFSNCMAQKNLSNHVSVDSLVTAIDRDHSLKNLAIEVPGMTTEGSAFVGYYDDKSNDIRKLVVRHFGEMGNTATTYYIEENQLIYQKRLSNNYDKPFYMKEHTVKSDSVAINCLSKKSGCDQSSFANDLSVFRKEFEKRIAH